jgi:hypothetical protein
MLHLARSCGVGVAPVNTLLPHPRPRETRMLQYCVATSAGHAQAMFYRRRTGRPSHSVPKAIIESHREQSDVLLL